MGEYTYSTEYSDIIRGFDFSWHHEVGVFNPNDANFHNILIEALKAAFKDFNFRTLKKTKSATALFDGKVVTDELVKILDEKFIQRYEEYFKNAPVPDFNEWHKESCDVFIKQLQSPTKIYENLCFGKAQKIVNMMFKHLYCVDGADKYLVYFQPCHMTLDRFTIEWIRRNIKQNEFKIPNDISWSNLDVDTYDKFTNIITKHFKGESITPFQIEFYIWPEIQWEIAAEEFILAYQPTEQYTRDDLKKIEKSKKIAIIKDLLN